MTDVALTVIVSLGCVSCVVIFDSGDVKPGIRQF